MIDDLNHMLIRLAGQSPGVSLDGFEDEVLADLARRREDMRAARKLSPFRAVSVGIAMAVGAATGGIAAATTLTQSHRLDTFSSGAHLAPSTLLEGRE